MNAKKIAGLMACLAIGLLVGQAPAEAVPITLSLSGTINDEQGGYAGVSGLLNAPYAATFTYESNPALAVESQLTPSNASDDYFTAFYKFANGPYGVNISVAGVGSFTTSSTALRIMDNVYMSSADTGGVLADGDYDFIELMGSIVTEAVCNVPGGCESSAEWTPVAAEELRGYIFADSSWFFGNAIPTTLPSAEQFVLSFLNGATYEDGVETGGISSDINLDLAKVSLAPVPLPGSCWLLCSGLAGLFGLGRGRRRRM